MKAKIKALTGRMSRLEYNDNGYDISVCGTVKKLFIICFNFQINGGSEIKIKFESVENIELIK